MMGWAAVALAIPAALFGAVTDRWAVAAVLVALILSSVVWRARLDLTRSARGWVTLGAMAAGGVLGAFVTPGGSALGRPWSAMALGALLAGAARLFLRAPGGGALATLLPGLAALTACGETRSGPLYVVAVAGYLGFAILALRDGDRGRPPWASLPRRAWGFSLIVIALATAACAGLVRVLPPLSDWSTNRLINVLAAPETGFSDRMWLGSLDGMLQSDEVVMRIEGPRVDYLRGAVYDRYDAGRWSSARPLGLRPVATPSRPRAGEAVTITVVGGARDRWFLPLGAHAVATREPGAAADRFGILRAGEGMATGVSFVLQGGADLPAVDPTADDLAIPPELASTLGRLVAEWTAGSATPEAKVEAIRGHLRADFAYSLQFRRRRQDPLLDFLLDERRGHCEYFASALALLARAAGVPARVAVGYRVAEESALGGYFLVRERNAHAWVEVFLPGRGFTTVDATPDADLSQNAPHRTAFVRAVLDLVAAGWARAVDRMARVSGAELLGALAGALAVGLLVRRLRRRRGRAAPFAGAASFEPPPPALERLLDALARRGAARSSSEPLERFAERLAGGDLAIAAGLLRRYAALRYGGVGDPEALLGELDRCAARLRRAG
jgi:transglutaminase-like putative cysteine protease